MNQRTAAPASVSPAATRPTASAWSLVPSLPLLIGLVALARALADPSALLHDPDTYLHIAAGRWLLAHHALPTTDPFSYTFAGVPWTAPEWLAELVLAGTYRLAGWSGVVILTAASFTVALALLTRLLLRRLDPLPTLIAVLGSTALLLPHLLARPHILALPLLVLWCGGVLAARDAGAAPPWALLPALTIWANLHGSFLVGLGLAGFAAAEAVCQPADGSDRGAEARRWGPFALAALGAALLTPHGLTGLIDPLRLIATPALQTSFGEWLPSDLARFPALELWLLAAVAVGFASGVRLPPSRLLLLLGLVHMSLAHVRHVDILAIVGPLAVAAPLGRGLAPTIPRTASRLQAGLARLAVPSHPPAAAMAFGLAALIVLPVAWQPIARADDAVTPGAALAEARRLGLSGPVFNSEAFGGYLAFCGIPTFIDGRIEMFGNDFLTRDVAAERGDPAELPASLARYHVTWTLLTPGAGAVAALDREPGWQRIYADAHAVIHQRVAAARP